MISTHVLDTSQGAPATAIQVKLEKMIPSGLWEKIGENTTDREGRIGSFSNDSSNTPGTYKLTFFIKSYFENRKINSFYPQIEICFQTEATQHYHVPVLINPYGYTTYRGC